MGVAIFYSEPGNADCNHTRRELRNAGVEFEEINVQKDAEALAFVTEALGYEVRPVVWFDSGLHWCGHDAAQIKAAVRLG